MSAQHVQKHTKTFLGLEFILGVLTFDNEYVHRVIRAEPKDSFTYFYRAFLHKSLVKADQHISFVCAKGNMSNFFPFSLFRFISIFLMVYRPSMSNNTLFSKLSFFHFISLVYFFSLLFFLFTQGFNRFSILIYRLGVTGQLDHPLYRNPFGQKIFFLV